VLSPQQEGSYKLIADWYRELNELFPGKFFHIGEDETFELGEGQSRDAVKAKGVGVVYFDHLQKVQALLKLYDRKLMFWGDIALNHPDLLELSEKSGRPVTDPWCSRLAAMHLKHIVETGEDMEKSLITPSLTGASA